MTTRKESRTRALKQFESGCLSNAELFLPRRELLAAEAKKLIEMMPVDDEVHRRGAARTLNGGLALLDEVLASLGDEDWQLRDTLTLAAHMLVSAGGVVAQAVLLNEHLRADTRAHGFDEHNAQRAAVQMRAQEIARELWAQDTAQGIRTGEMGQLVLARLAAEPNPYTPDSRAVTAAVRQVAPAYAKKPGRSRK